MAKICKFCWEPIPDGEEICRHCGKNINEVLERTSYNKKQSNETKKTTQEDEENIEKTTQKENEENIEETEKTEAEKQSEKYKVLENISEYREPEPERKPFKIWILPVAILLIAALFFGFMKFKSNGGKNKELNKLLGVMALEQKQHEEDIKFFDPDSKIKYSDNPYFKDKKGDGDYKPREDLFDQKGGQVDWGGDADFGAGGGNFF